MFSGGLMSSLFDLIFNISWNKSEILSFHYFDPVIEVSVSSFTNNIHFSYEKQISIDFLSLIYGIVHHMSYIELKYCSLHHQEVDFQLAKESCLLNNLFDEFVRKGYIQYKKTVTIGYSDYNFYDFTEYAFYDIKMKSVCGDER